MDFDHFAEHMGDGADERHRKCISDLETAARKIGLYLDQAAIAATPDTEPGAEPTRLMVMVGFTIGDLAWSARTQDPETAAFDHSFREMRVEQEDAEFEAMRRQWKEGNLGWKPKDDDDQCG